MRHIHDEELTTIKNTVLDFLEDAKEWVEKDFYIPEEDADREAVFQMLGGNLLNVAAMRYALYHDLPRAKEMAKLWKEMDLDNLFDLAITLEDLYGGTGSNRERELKELATKILALLDYTIPNRR